MLFLASGGFNNMAISVEERYFESPEHVAAFLDLSLALYDLMHPAYGYIHDIEDKLETRTVMDPKYGKTVIPTKLTKGLPGIYWANLLGPEYVAMLGRKQLLSAPCFRLEELPDGGMLLLTSPSPLGLLSRDNLQARHKLRQYLGEDLFYPSQAVSTRVPKFKGDPSPRGTDRDLLISFDPGKAEKKAQAQNFIDNAEDLASLLIDELANQGKILDYNLSSLRILDQILLHKREAGEALDEFSAKMFAAYAGEVAKRALEGQWIVDEVTSEAALRIKDAKIYPLSRVFKFWESEERNAFATVFDILGAVTKNEILADRKQGGLGYSV
jgi:hypothetical protein